MATPVVTGVAQYVAMTLRLTDPKTIETVLTCISTKNRIADPMFTPNRFLFDDTTSYTSGTCNQTMSIIDENEPYTGFLASIFN